MACTDIGISPCPVIKTIGSSLPAAASSRWNSRPLCPGNLTSSTRQLGPSVGSDLRKSETDANSLAFKPTDRSRRPSELRRSTSSSMTKIVEVASSIAAAQSWRSRATLPTQVSINPALRRYSRNIDASAKSRRSIGSAALIVGCHAPSARTCRLPRKASRSRADSQSSRPRSDNILRVRESRWSRSRYADCTVCLAGQSLNSHRSRYGLHVDDGDGHVLDLLSRIQRHVDHDRHVFGATLRLSQRKLSKQNDVRPTYDFRGDRQVPF